LKVYIPFSAAHFYKIFLAKGDVSKEKISNLMAMTKKACMTTRERIFGIMEAHAQGWGFAKTLNFYQDGTS